MQPRPGALGHPGRSSHRNEQTKLNHITDDHSSLEWTTLDDLEVGEFYTLGTESPMTFLLVGRALGRGGRHEFDVTTLVGASGGRAYTRTYWRPKQEVLVVPAEYVGDRLTAAAVAFAERERRGLDRIELGSDTWPWCLEAETEEASA